MSELGKPTDQAAFPLTAAQRMMWLSAQLDPDGAALNLPIVLRLRGELSVARLAEAVRALVARHSMLRLQIFDEAGSPYQRACPPPQLSLEVTEYANETELLRCLEHEMSQPVDLTRGVAIRVRLYRRSATEHVLLLLLNHLSCDGWSLDLLVEDLLDGYRQGSGSCVTQPAGDFSEYAEWEHSADGAAQRAADLAYWRTRPLARVEPGLPFAQDRGAASEPIVQLENAFGAPLVAELRHGARGLRTTGSAFWIAAVTGMVYLANRDRTVNVAVPANNRRLGKFSNTVGPFVSLLPLVVALPHEATGRTLVEESAASLFDGAEHDCFPLDALLQEIGDGRVDGRFQSLRVLLSYARTNDGWVSVTDELEASRADHLAPAPQGLQSDLAIFITESDSELRLRLVARGDVYDNSGLDRFCSRMVALAKELVERPDQRLDAIELVGDQERHQLLELGNGGEPGSGSFVGDAYRGFRAAAERDPAAGAVVDGAGAHSYGSVARLAENFAVVLAGKGVKRGSVVAVALPPSVTYVASVLALWHLGACPVPIGVNIPAARRRQLFELSGCKHAVADEDLQPQGSFCAIGTDELYRAAGESSGSCPPIVSLAELEPAFGVFTSGSTGTPKLTLNTHRGLANNLAWRAEATLLRPGDRVLQTIPLAFGPSFWQCFGPLCFGAAVAFLPEGPTHPAAVVAAAQDLEATISDFVPSLLAAVESRDLAKLPFRLLFCGGEPLPAQEAARHRAYGTAELLNQYGASEVCMDAASHRCGADRDTMPIGRPIANVQLYVVDPHLRLVPTGAVGELCVAGDSVGLGYLSQPALTASRFVPDPFTGDGRRMYRTGDLVRWNSRGELEFVGRVDDQVQIRGHRVELGEVASAVAGIEGVRDAAVVAAGDRHRRLVAFVVSDGVTRDILIDGLRESLPAYMVPSEIRMIDALPIGSTGKVDRQQLEAMARVGAVEASETWDATESLVAETFKSILELTSVALDDDLFELGGASLLAARVAASLTQATGREISIKAVLEHSRVRELAQFVKQSEPIESQRVTRSFADGPSPEQEYLFELARASSRSIPPVTGLIPWQPSWTPQIEDMLSALRSAHPVLSVTPLTDGAASSVESFVGSEISIVPLEGDFTAEILLARPCADGVSVDLVARDISDLVRGEAISERPTYAEYVDYWRERSARGFERAAHYWDGVLSGVTPDLFQSRRQQVRSFENRVISVPVGDLATRVSERAASARLMATIPYLAAFAAAVREVSSEPSVVVGIPYSRRSERFQTTVGRCVDLIPFVVSEQAHVDSEHELEGLQASLIDALDHPEIPLVELAKRYDELLLAHRPPLAQVGLIMEAAPPDPERSRWADIDLVLHVHRVDDRVTDLSVSGSIDLFTERELASVVDQVTAELRSFVGISEGRLTRRRMERA